LPASVIGLLRQVQSDLLQAATERLQRNTISGSSVTVADLGLKSGQPLSGQMSRILDTERGADECKTDSSSTAQVSPFVMAPWHDDADAEARLKELTGFTIRCFPVGESVGTSPETLPVPQGSLCFYTGRPATHIALFARAF
jgi:hypothetical protein